MNQSQTLNNTEEVKNQVAGSQTVGGSIHYAPVNQYFTYSTIPVTKPITGVSRATATAEDEFAASQDVLLTDIQQPRSDPSNHRVSNEISREASHRSPHSKHAKCFIPYRRNPQFIGRLEEVKLLHDCIRDSTGTDGETSQQRAAIYGLGGVGKTQLAVEFAYSFKDAHPHYAIFWIHADTSETIRQSFTSLAASCDVDRHTSGHPDILRTVVAWLKSDLSPHWLMIIDNADDPEVLFGFQARLADAIRSCSRGAVLTTTRNKKVALNMASHHNNIHLKAMDEYDAVAVLTSCFRDVPNQDDAKIVSGLLGHLPLALVQAATFVRENSITLSKYIQMWNDSYDNAQMLLSFEFHAEGRTEVDPELPNAMTAALTLTLDSLTKKNKLASDILMLMTYFDHNSIPEDLLLEDNTSANNVAFVAALGDLCALSLVSRNIDGRFLEIHRLVHMITYRWQMKCCPPEVVAAKALHRLNRAFPTSPTRTDRPRLDAYLPHALCYLEKQDHKTSGHGLEKIALQRKVADHLLYQGRTSEAEIIRERVLTEMEELENASFHDVLRARYELAAVLKQLRRFNKAKKICESIVNTCEGENIVGMIYINTLNLLCQLLVEKRSYLQAHKTANRARQASAAYLSEDDEETIKISFQIALIKRQEAIDLSQRDPSKREKLLLESKNILNDAIYKLRDKTRIRNNSSLIGMQYLSKVLDDLHEPTESEAIRKKILALKVEALGQNHVETFQVMRNLANFYVKDDQVDKAEKLLQQLLDQEGSILGRRHPDHLKSRRSLSKAIEKRGDLHCDKMDISQAVCKEIQGRMQLRESRDKGDDDQVTQHEMARVDEQELVKHEETIKTAKACAIKEFTNAIELQRELIIDMKDILGHYQPETLDLMSDLASAIQKALLLDGWKFAGLIIEAQELLQEVLAHQERLHALDQDDHEDILSAKARLAALLYVQEDFEKAEALERYVLKCERHKNGLAHPRTLMAMHALAETLFAQGQEYTRMEAILLMKSCCEYSKELLGVSHSDTEERVGLLRDWETSALFDASNSSARSARIMREYEVMRPTTVSSMPWNTPAFTLNASHRSASGTPSQVSFAPKAINIIKGFRIPSFFRGTTMQTDETSSRTSSIHQSSLPPDRQR